MGRRLGLVSLALYRYLAGLVDWRAHVTGYLFLHIALFAVYGILVGLLTWKSFTRPPWTTERMRPPVMVARRETDPAAATIRRAASIEAASRGAGVAAAGEPETAPDDPEMAPDEGTAAELAWPPAPARPMSRITPLLLIAFAVAFRVTLLFVPASLSHDVHRAVWDGRVLASGGNPYRETPASARLAPLRDAGWAQIDHPSEPSASPPLSAAVFGLAARAGLGEIGFKSVFVLFDIMTIVALGFLLRRIGRPMSWVALYAWNPLVVMEIAGSGHAEPLAVILLVLAAIFIAGERRILGIGGYALSIFTRLIPLSFAPIVIRRFKAPHLLLGAAVAALGWLAYPGAGAAASARLADLAATGGHNVVVFPLVRAAIDIALPEKTAQPPGPDRREDTTTTADPVRGGWLARWAAPGPLALVVLALALLGGTIAISLDVEEITGELLCASALVLVLAPRVDPWHALWIVPFAAAEVSLPGLLFTGLVPLSYLSLRVPGGEVSAWALAVEWGAPAVLAIVLAARKRAVTRRIRDRAARA
jgi:hypothetical protein